MRCGIAARDARSDRVINNPLLQLKPEEISLLRFGDSYVEYEVRGRLFKLPFPSREVMDAAVEEWIMVARERGEFFRLEALKALKVTQRRQIRHMSKKPLH